MRPGVSGTFAKAFYWKLRLWGGSRETDRRSDRSCDRGSDNPPLETPAVLRAGQLEPAAKRQLALWRRLQLALMDIQRREPPDVTSFERHGDCRIQNGRRTVPIPGEAIYLGEQRQVIRPARLRALCVEPFERQLDRRDAFGGSLLSARPPDEDLGPFSVVGKSVSIAQRHDR